MAKKELFRPRLGGYFVRGFGAFPVQRGQLDRQAMRQAYRVLAEGRALAMFPEGTRSLTGKLQPGLPGSALVALRSGAPILPVGIFGTEKIKGVAWIWHRPRITVNVGPSFHLPPASRRPTRAELNGLTDFIMRRIAELLPAEYRGDYGDKESR